MHLRCREFGCTVSSFQCTVSEHAWSQPEPRKELPRVVLLTVRDSAADFGLCAGFAVQALVHRRAARLAISPVWAVESLRWVEPIRSVGFKASSCMQVQTSILWQRMVSSQGYPLIEVCFLLPTHYQSRTQVPLRTTSSPGSTPKLHIHTQQNLENPCEPSHCLLTGPLLLRPNQCPTRQWLACLVRAEDMWYLVAS